LIVPFPESSLNDEAGKLFMDSYDEFARRARIMTQVHAMRSNEAEADSTGKKLSGADDETPTVTRVPATGEEENESANGSAAKVPAQKRKAVDAKKKAMKRL
jgi:ubiquitin-conjugating enzyme E2 S